MRDDHSLAESDLPTLGERKGFHGPLWTLTYKVKSFQVQVLCFLLYFAAFRKATIIFNLGGFVWKKVHKFP